MAEGKRFYLTKAKRFYLTVLLWFYCAILVLLCGMCFLGDIWPPHSTNDQTNWKKRYFPLTLCGETLNFPLREAKFQWGDATNRWGDASLLQFKCWLYFHSQVTILFHYYHTATVRNLHQLLTCKTSKWHSLLFQKNYYLVVMFWRLLARAFIINRLRAIWLKGYQRGSLRKTMRRRSSSHNHQLHWGQSDKQQQR